MSDAPQPPSYPTPSGPPPAAASGGGRGLAITALVVGLLALLFCWTVVGGIVLGVIALIVGVIAMRKAKRGEADGRGLAIAGVVLGVLGLLVGLGILVIGALFLNSDSFKNLQDCARSAQTQSDRDQCEKEFQGDLEN